MLDAIRIGCAVPAVRVADTGKNARNICERMAQAAEAGCQVLVFPELALTGYTCGDLFFQQVLTDGALAGLSQVVSCSAAYPAVAAVVGLPVWVEGSLYNCAAVIQSGKVLSLVGKGSLPDYRESAERRWFAPACGKKLLAPGVLGLGQDAPVPFGSGLVTELAGGIKLGVMLGEELFEEDDFGALMAAGADVVANPAAFAQLVGKQAQRRARVLHRSGMCAYALCGAGCSESTRDLVFSGQSVIAAGGQLLAENEKLADNDYFLMADVSMTQVQKTGAYVPAMKEPAEKPLSAQPFDVSVAACREMFQIQAAGLAQRLKTLGANAVIGVSGGLDSTLALLVCVEAMYRLGRPVSDVYAVTMPCFGTSDRTYRNAQELMRLLGVNVKEINIRNAVMQHFSDIGHDPAVLNATYENAQARERTQILMDYASVVGGIVVGTGDISELALGWCTYNGDHMSMYGVNGSIPKTVMAPIIREAAKLPAYAPAKAVLEDIVDTPISPELLPADDQGKIAQKTEDLVGPYALHDFFLYYVLKYGYAPGKIYALAKEAFAGEYDAPTIQKWLKAFYRRFFTQQFKRSCMPEGVCVGELSLSPRGDWMMPSDAVSSIWLEEVEKL